MTNGLALLAHWPVRISSVQFSYVARSVRASADFKILGVMSVIV